MAGTFPFFDLPLELRTMIYHELSKPVTTVRIPGQSVSPPEFVWKASVKSCVILGMLGISKQFKQEYERELYQNAKLCLKYDPWQALGIYGFPVRRIELPGCLLANICHVEFDVVLRDWSATVKPMLEEKHELFRLCNLPNLRTLEMHFTIPPEMPEYWLNEETEPYDDISELFRLIRNFSTCCRQVFKSAQVDIGVYVKTRFFEPYMIHIYRDTRDQLNLEDLIIHGLDNTGVHEAIWKASVAQPGDQYAFEGMHLEFLRGGHFDAEEYDELYDSAVGILEDEKYWAGEKSSLIG